MQNKNASHNKTNFNSNNIINNQNNNKSLKKDNNINQKNKSNNTYNSLISSEQISYSYIGEPMNINSNNSTISSNNIQIANNHSKRKNDFSVSSFALSSSEINHYMIRPENPNIKAKKDSIDNNNHILRQFPENKIKDLSKLNEENKRCIICLEEYKIDDITLVLPCFHFFHKNCIINWSKKKAICPLCKLDIKNYK